MRSRPDLVLLIVSFILVSAMERELLAAQKKTQNQTTPVVSMKDIKVSSEQVQKPSAPRVTKADRPTLAERKPLTLSKPATSARAEPSPKSHRTIKVHKKVVPKAVVQPRTDLTYYGVLEDPQRYDPRPNSRMAGVPNPQTPDLTHDHFQELDRNQDGKIDPVERAFGRLDMDHDLYNRQLR